MRRISLFLATALVVSSISVAPEVSLHAKGKVKLSSKKVTVNVGKTKKLSVKNYKKKATWKISKGKKFIKISAKKAKGIKITGLKKGNAKILCKAGKKKLVCVVKVKADKVNTANTATSTPKVSSTAAPTASTRPTHAPTSDRMMAEPLKVEQAIDGGSMVFSLDKYYYFYGTEVSRTSIESVEFMNTSKVPSTSDVLGAYDISEKQNKSVMAWYKDADKDGFFEIYIGQDGGVVANPNSDYMFCWIAGTAEKSSALDDSKCLLGLENLYTEDVESANYMFACFGWYNFQKISLGDYFATSNLKSALYMFADAGHNSEIYLGKAFSLDKLEDKNLSSMFAGRSGRVSKVVVPKAVKERFDKTKEIADSIEVEVIK